MELILTDRNFNELGILKHGAIDLEIGKYGVSQNDFELSMPTTNRFEGFDINSLIYVEGSEYGGIVTSKKVDTLSSDITFNGVTWRGLLEKEYIQPPFNQTHYIANGEANAVLQELIQNRFDDLIVVDDVGLSEIQVNYQIRDMNLLDAIDRMLINANARLNVSFSKGKLHLKCVRVNDLSNELQYDKSYGLQMIVETPKKQYNHILVLGKGVGLDRTRINLFLQDDGTWSDSINHSGLERKTYKYANSSTEEARDGEEDIEELKTKAIEKVESENGSNTVTVSFDEDNAELFDIVSSREKETNVFFKSMITQKIVKGTINNYRMIVDIEYKVGDNK